MITMKALPIGGYLGLDIAAKSSHYAVTDDGEHYEQGIISPEMFPQLLEKYQPVAVGVEYTGRLAEIYCLTAQANHIPAFLLHTRMRKSMTGMIRQTSKTDREDARTISHYLRLWHNPYLRRVTGIKDDTFTDSAEVRDAWILRAYIADYNAWNKVRIAAQLRVKAAQRVGLPEREVLWTRLATDETPEECLHKAKAYAMHIYPSQYQNLLTIPYIGEKTALQLLATLMPIERFEEKRRDTGEDTTIRNVRRYVGMYPRQFESGAVGLPGNNKAASRGNPMLRSTLTIAARGAAITTRQNFLAAEYRELIAKGMRPSQAINRIATHLLRIAVAILRKNEPYFDPLAPPPPPPRPEHLIPQAEAARILGFSRQRVHQWIAAGKIKTEDYDGKTYCIAKSIDTILSQRV